jgi:cysteine synthase A
MTTGALIDCVGHTPLIHLARLSRAIGRDVFGKAEHLNPGGSVKDRAARAMILDAEQRGVLAPGGTIVEGTAGNTGIGLALLGRTRDYHVVIVMPDNQAPEKFELLEALGAEVVKVKPTKFADPAHFYHTAQRLAEARGGFWANQFENPANADAHFTTTGPELWADLDGRVDAIALASGTGGSIGGISRFLKAQDPRVRVVLLDPLGSGLSRWFRTGKMEAVGSSITEGIGIMRVTANFAQAQLDDALEVTDTQLVAMAHWLAANEGLVVGTSAALNVFGAAKVALGLPAGARVATLVCDGGQRYQSRLFNAAWLAERGLLPPAGQSLEAVLATS